MPRDSSVPAPLNGRFVASVRFATPAGRDEAEVLLADMRRVAAPIVDTTDPTMITRAYDPATLDRLRQIVEKFDPTGVFGAAGELQLGRRASMTGQGAPAR